MLREEGFEIGEKEPDEARAFDARDGLGRAPVVERARCDAEVVGGLLLREQIG